MDDFPESLKDVVNDHWRQFPPQHPLINIWTGLSFFALTVIGLIANFIVIFTFFSDKNIRTPVRLTLKFLIFI